MNILITNDDGVHAAGIKSLQNALKALGDVWVVAPDRERSGASCSLTFKQPLRVKSIDKQIFVTDGTPGDCVNLAVRQILPKKPDVVISGVNHGANLADDLIYSGTIGAAREGDLFGIPSMAISLVDAEGEGHFDTAASIAVQLAEKLVQRKDSSPLLNVNVPNVLQSELQGFAVTRMGRRNCAERTLVSEDPIGRPMYWIGPPCVGLDDGEGTDMYAVAHRKVSITPLVTDYTFHDKLTEMYQWVADVPQLS